MTHAELIAALESATGPSRELDVAISVAIGREDETTLIRYTDGTEKRHPTSRNPWGGQVDSPRYTASIDAALTLVPEGLRWRVSCVPVHQFAGASVLDGSILSPNTKEWEGKHATPAIALCIAALKARKETT